MDRMASTSSQYVNNAEGIGTPATVYYQYDGQGNRTRKVVDDQAPSRRRERRYIGEYETYWSTPYPGSATEINHTSVHISDETGRFVLLEFNGSTVSTRYQHSDHLGSSFCPEIWPFRRSPDWLILKDSPQKPSFFPILLWNSTPPPIKPSHGQPSVPMGAFPESTTAAPSPTVPPCFPYGSAMPTA